MTNKYPRLRLVGLLVIGSLMLFAASLHIGQPMQLLADQLAYRQSQLEIALTPNGSQPFSFEALAGEFRFYCSVPGHTEAGMAGTLFVEDSKITTR